MNTLFVHTDNNLVIAAQVGDVVAFTTKGKSGYFFASRPINNEDIAYAIDNDVYEPRLHDLDPTVWEDADEARCIVTELEG